MKRNQTAEVVSIQPKYLSMADAMKYMGCKRDMLCRLRDEGSVRVSKIGKMLYFNLEDMDKLFEKNIINAQLWSMGY